MEKKWKIAIIILFILVAWIRLSPAIPWTLKAIDWGERNVAYYERCVDYRINYNWSWWSFRFTAIYAECIK